MQPIVVNEGRAFADAGLTILYRGATIRLEADDPRLAFFELLLFGRPLPPPVPFVEQPAPAAKAAPEPGPERVDVPPVWQTFWKTITPQARRVLVALANQELTTPQLEALLGVRKGSTRAPLIAIGLRAKAAGLSNPVSSAGSGRLGRRMWLSVQARPYVLELDRRWRKVAEALAEAEGA